LMMFYGLALLSFVVFISLACFALYHKFVTGLAIPGWTSFVMTASFFGAMNALGIAMLGEYVLRIYDQVRGRPMYLVQRKVNVGSDGVEMDGDGGKPGEDERGVVQVN